MSIFGRNRDTDSHSPEPIEYPLQTPSGKSYFCESCGRKCEVRQESQRFDKETGKQVAKLYLIVCPEFAYYAMSLYDNGHTKDTVEEKVSE